MKIVTFNTRTYNEDDGVNLITNRLPFIKSKIEAEQPDIIGFQELKPREAMKFKETFPEYTFVGSGRNADHTGERIPIAFRSDRFDLADMHECWLSDTPDVPGSMFEGQSPCPRMIVCARLVSLADNRCIRIYNTHLDHPDGPLFVPRMKGLKKSMEMIRSDSLKSDAPFVFMGDLNAEPADGDLDEIFADSAFTDVTGAFDVTYHAYGDPSKYKKIDYIFISKGLKCDNSEVWTDRCGELWLSDHYPVCAEIEFER